LPCSEEPGEPGIFDIFDQQQSEIDAVLPVALLHNERSLIGQLCPGLRLCLAAEVATGLMCDRCGGSRLWGAVDV
jgi:hypothetical protein